MDSDYITNREFSPFPDREAVERADKNVQLQVEQNFDLLSEIVAHFDTVLETYRSNRTNPIELTLRPKEHAIHTRANIQTARFIEAERGFIQDLIDQYKR